MARRPFMKFFGTDHRADAALRCCGFAARGLWTDMLTLMMEAEPYGHLVISGRPATARKLAQLLGGTEEEVGRLLAELEDAGVFSRTVDGVIYSRRMVRDAGRADQGRAWQEYRWATERGLAPPRPPQQDRVPPQLKLVGGADLPEPVRGPDSPPTGDPSRVPSRVPSRDPIAYSQSPESRVPPTPRPRGAGPAGRGGAGPVWMQEMLRHEPETGRQICNGWYWDEAKERVARAARLPEAWSGSWEALARWLGGGGDTDQPGRDLDDICTAIENVAARPNYEPPAALKYFDRPVASYGVRVRGRA